MEFNDITEGARDAIDRYTDARNHGNVPEPLLQDLRNWRRALTSKRNLRPDLVEEIDSLLAAGNE